MPNTEDLSNNGRQTKLMVGVLTGPCGLNKYEINLSLMEDTIRRSCQMKEETEEEIEARIH